MTRAESHSTTLPKHLKILEILSQPDSPLTYSKILDRSSLPKSTGYRLVSILTNERLVFFDPEHRPYRIGYRMLELAARGLNSFDLRQIAASFLRKLGEATQENVLLAVRDGLETA